MKVAEKMEKAREAVEIKRAITELERRLKPLLTDLKENMFPKEAFSFDGLGKIVKNADSVETQISAEDLYPEVPVQTLLKMVTVSVTAARSELSGEVFRKVSKIKEKPGNIVITVG